MELVCGHLESPSAVFFQLHSYIYCLYYCLFFLVMGTKPTALHLMVRCSTPKLNLLLLVYGIVMVSVNVNDQSDNILGSLEGLKEHL